MLPGNQAKTEGLIQEGGVHHYQMTDGGLSPGVEQLGNNIHAATVDIVEHQSPMGLIDTRPRRW